MTDLTQADIAVFVEKLRKEANQQGDHKTQRICEAIAALTRNTALVEEVRANSRWRNADWYDGVVFEVPEPLFARILAALEGKRT